MARLTGTGLVADDLYLMSHHEVTGRPYLHHRAIGVGLAGALLAELVLAGSIRIWPEGVAPAGRSLPAGELARSVLALVVSERRRVPDWLAFLARSAERDVARRLEHEKYLTLAGSRRPWRTGRWVPVDPDCAFAPLFRAQAALDPGKPVTVAGATLAGLATACGLGSRLLPYGPKGARRWLDETVRQLAPDLRELIAQTQAATDSLLLSQRV
ncbi:MAG TPA: GPP34 family phosphoprotein [Streptosporangiaceae bacterium]|nr:GPP34 family phosphoprotein [Streptosporangiaceae bacterium]